MQIMNISRNKHLDRGFVPGPKSMRGLPVWFLKVLPTILPWRQATLIPL